MFKKRRIYSIQVAFWKAQSVMVENDKHVIVRFAVSHPFILAVMRFYTPTFKDVTLALSHPPPQ